MHLSFEKPVRFDVGLAMYRLVRTTRDDGFVLKRVIEMENAESMPLRSGSLFSKNEFRPSDSVNLRIHDRFYSLVLRLEKTSKLQQ